MQKTLRKRPIVISIFCVLGFLVSAAQIILISSPSIRGVAKWYPVVYGTITALRFISLVGLWNMKKWAAELFVYILLVKIIVQVLLDDFGGLSILDTFISAIFSVVLLRFYKRMDRNL